MLYGCANAGLDRLFLECAVVEPSGSAEIQIMIRRSTVSCSLNFSLSLEWMKELLVKVGP